jgi:hypothetical protein
MLSACYPARIATRQRESHGGEEKMNWMFISVMAFCMRKIWLLQSLTYVTQAQKGAQHADLVLWSKRTISEAKSV